MIHVILPVHNRRETTAAFVARLCDQTLQDFRLVLVDDGCVDGTVDDVRGRLDPSRLTVLRGNGDLWWAGALQLAYEAICSDDIADDDAVLIVNDDVTFGSDFLALGCAALGRNPNACIQAFGTDLASGAFDLGVIANRWLLTFRVARDGERPNCLSTRGLLMRAGTFRRSQGFRARLLPHYLSDYEFTMRLHAMGIPLLVDPRFRLVADSATTGLGTYEGGLRRFWATTFTNRAKYNPLHWSVFVVLVCPWLVVPLHITRIWLRFGAALLRASIRRDPARTPVLPLER